MLSFEFYKVFMNLFLQKTSGQLYLIRYTQCPINSFMTEAVIIQKPVHWFALPNAYSPFLKLSFGNSSQKTRKSRYQTFLFLTSFTGFLYFIPNILSGIVWANKVLVSARPSLLQTLIFWHFVNRQRISPIFRENINQASFVKLPNLMILCKQHFAYLV